MADVRVTFPNAVVGGGVFDPGDGAPAGTWNDDSDATFAVGDSASKMARNPSVTQNASLAVITAHVRYSGAGAPSVGVAEFAHGGFPILTLTAMPGGATASPTWTSVEMSGAVLDFLNELHEDADSQRYLYLLGDNANKYYEAYMIVQGPGEPASCRNFPASTSSSVGGMARNFPPSKFTGHSSRFAGGHN